jgi:hypothetical protein
MITTIQHTMRRSARRIFLQAVKPIRLLLNAQLLQEADDEIDRLTDIADELPKLISREHARRLVLIRRRNDLLVD